MPKKISSKNNRSLAGNFFFCKQDDLVKWNFLLFLWCILIFWAQKCWFIELTLSLGLEMQCDVKKEPLFKGDCSSYIFKVCVSYLYWKWCPQIHLELFLWLFFHCWYYFGYFHHHNNMACPRQKGDFCFVQFHHYLICTFYFAIDFPILANVL